MSEWRESEERYFEVREYGGGLVGKVGKFPGDMYRFAALNVDGEILWSHGPDTHWTQEELQAFTDRKAGLVLAVAERLHQEPAASGGEEVATCDCEQCEWNEQAQSWHYGNQDVEQCPECRCELRPDGTYRRSATPFGVAVCGP